jgi:acyl carrier protein
MLEDSAEERREHMDIATVQRSLRQFVADNLIEGRTDVVVEDDESFFEKGVIDSTGVLELVLFIEQTYGFAVLDEEIVPENLDSFNRIVAYIQSKLKNHAGKV